MVTLVSFGSHSTPDSRAVLTQ